MPRGDETLPSRASGFHDRVGEGDRASETGYHRVTGCKTQTYPASQNCGGPAQDGQAEDIEGPSFQSGGQPGGGLWQPPLTQWRSPPLLAKAQRQMTKDGFLMYLLSADGSAFSLAHRRVYQDMSQPLSHYLVSSSHNTYLLEDQLTGPSSTEAYIRCGPGKPRGWESGGEPGTGPGGS